MLAGILLLLRGRCMLLRGVRSVEIETPSVSRTAEFYTRVWGLDLAASNGGSAYLRGSGIFHHVLAIHNAADAPSLRRVTFDAPDRAAVDALFHSVKNGGYACEKPHAVSQPGGGYGFGFTD